jgi:hypothetical protein
MARQLTTTSGLSARRRIAAISTAGTQRVRSKAVRHVRKVRCAYALRLHRPLPDALREANTFQRIAKVAQDRYVPPKVDVPIVVYRAEGLYYEPALGWDEYSRQIIDCVEVPGYQPVPRKTMRQPSVGYLAKHLMAQLGEDVDSLPDHRALELAPEPAEPRQ